MEDSKAKKELIQTLEDFEKQLPKPIVEEITVHLDMKEIAEGKVIFQDGIYEVETDQNGVLFAVKVSDKELMVEKIDILRKDETTIKRQFDTMFSVSENGFEVRSLISVMNINCKDETAKLNMQSSAELLDFEGKHKGPIAKVAYDTVFFEGSEETLLNESTPAQAVVNNTYIIDFDLSKKNTQEVGLTR